jgi:hypothetical protein
MEYKIHMYLHREFFENLGPNPSIATYNASVVNFYNATGCIVRFIKKNIFFFY